MHWNKLIKSIYIYRRLHDDREEWGRQMERKTQELHKHKETVEVIHHNLPFSATTILLTTTLMMSDSQLNLQ